MDNLEIRSRLRLVERSEKLADENGWIKASVVVGPLLRDIPSELLDHKSEHNRDFYRLTEAGRLILRFGSEQ